MKKRDMIMVKSDNEGRLERDIRDATESLLKDFKYDDNKSNYEANSDYVMQYLLVKHELVSTLQSYLKKEMDRSKKAIDGQLTDLDIDPASTPDSTKELYNNGTIAFSKKQNKNGSGVSTKDLLTELARAGVEKDVVAKAVAAATKEKRGNVYYLVEVIN